eukprot:scaffold1869_cov122-Cylindrotheca_fusiformis.AAC.48
MKSSQSAPQTCMWEMKIQNGKCIWNSLVRMEASLKVGPSCSALPEDGEGMPNYELGTSFEFISNTPLSYVADTYD